MVHLKQEARPEDRGPETNENSTQVSPVIAGLIVTLIFALPCAMYFGLYELRKLADIPPQMIRHDEL